MKLYIFKYNNYYNRIVKKEDSLNAYLTAVGIDNYEFCGNVNYAPQDFVNMKQIVDTNFNADYAIYFDENNNIVSRWYIIEAARTAYGQLELTLHRDLVVDNIEQIKNADCFIEKATLDDSDPAIFNPENMDFNQIKTSETQLKDETDSAWIVGYIAKPESGETDTNLSIKVNLPVDEYVDSIENYQYYHYTNLDLQDPNGYFLGNDPYPAITINARGYKSDASNPYQFTRFSFDEFGQNSFCFPAKYTISTLGRAIISDVSESLLNEKITSYGVEMNSQTPVTLTHYFNNYSDAENILDSFKFGFSNYFQTIKSQISTILDIHTDEEVLNFKNEVGKIIYDQTTQKYYKVQNVSIFNINLENYYPGNGALKDTFISGYNASKLYPGSKLVEFFGNDPTLSQFCFGIQTEIPKFRLNLVEIQHSETYTSKLSVDRYHLTDAPYDMFAIPYSDTLQIKNNSTVVSSTSKIIAFATAMEIASQMGGANGKLFDLQLLPYCPVRFCIQENGDFDVLGYKYDFIKDSSSNNKGIIIYASESNFSFNIPYSIEVHNKKLENLTDMYRLCSPNYNGVFEFNPAKNNGVEYFNVDCTYKPFSPYIHLNPNFKELYGNDYDDARGLICGGDFSLPEATDAWATYQRQNVNYQQIFDRQIQNMETTQDIQRQQEIFQTASGMLSGAAAGATAGSIFGGIGAAIGMAVGGVASTAAGIADLAMNDKLRNEAIDYTKDQFGFKMGNIKALPDSLAKVSAYNKNNKIFPFIEYYTCTATEKQALQDKIKFNGMTVGRIGKIKDYIRNEKTYIKAKLIRLENVSDDYHYFKSIADELYKGVYI